MLINASADMIYGDTGATKTSRLGDAAEYFYEKTGKPSRLICTDNAGWGPLDSLIDAGIIVPFRVSSSRPYLLQDLSRLSKGWWPTDAADPMSPLEIGNLSNVGAILFDGITTTCQLIMEFHQKSIEVVNEQMRATSVKVPEMPKDSYVKSGEGSDAYVRRFVGRSDYMGVQDRAQEFIRNSSKLDVPTIWTALEAKGEDDYGKPIYGPQFIGKALTGVCGPWFGNLLHLDFVAKKDPKTNVEALEPVMFLKRHFDPLDPLKIPYPAKVRAPRTMHAEVPAMCPPDLKALYKFLDELRERERKNVVQIAVTAEVAE